MVAGSIRHAMIFTLVFMQVSQTVISILKTRFNLWAHDILRAWYGSFESFSCSAKKGLFFPRREAVTSARTLAFGAKPRTEPVTGNG